MTLDWPDFVVQAVHTLRKAAGFFSDHAILGVPLDWAVRFCGLGVLYLILRAMLTRRAALATCVAILLLKESFDIVAHLNLLRPGPPDWGDLADVLSGLCGIACAAWLAGRRP